MPPLNSQIKLAVDMIVFSVMKGELAVLLIRRKYEPFKGEYAIPGGFVRVNESLEEAALRELEEETGVRDIFLKKLTAYGDLKRDPRGRVVSVAFIGLIDAQRFRLSARSDSLSAEWVPVTSVSKLAFDHQLILMDALAEMRFEVQTTNIAAQLLPAEFSLTELQALYEAILGRSLDKRNFRKRIKTLGILGIGHGVKMEGAHRPAQLFRFKTKDYTQLREKIHIFL